LHRDERPLCLCFLTHPRDRHDAGDGFQPPDGADGISLRGADHCLDRRWAVGLAQPPLRTPADCLLAVLVSHPDSIPFVVAGDAGLGGGRTAWGAGPCAPGGEYEDRSISEIAAILPGLSPNFSMG